MRISWNWLSEMVDLSKVGGPAGARPICSRVAGSRSKRSNARVKGLEESDHRPDPRAQPASAGGSSESLQSFDLARGAARDRLRRAEYEGRATKSLSPRSERELPNGLKIAKSKIRGVVSNGMLCSRSKS